MSNNETECHDGYSGDDHVAYIYSTDLINETNKISKISGRANLVNALIDAYGLFKYLKVIKPGLADDMLLKSYHSRNYVDFLKKFTNNNDEEKIMQTCTEDFGIGYDCPAIENMWDYCCAIAGASITAAQLIASNKYKYAVNWFGGWHHAQKDKASGFCYINDIVLCILKLREKYNRILYIDMDLHHGDGVQDAFELTDKVMCVSFHKYIPGFFPGTGSLDEQGKDKGKYHTINVPLFGGIDDKMFFDIFSKIFNEIIIAYKPEVLVIQCGADSLYGDPIDSFNPFNLTVNGYVHCIDSIIRSKLPTVFLGGGGYNFANTSRLWCSIVARLLKIRLENDIPEHDLFLYYGPSYELSTLPGTVKNRNSVEYMKKIFTNTLNNLELIKEKERADESH